MTERRMARDDDGESVMQRLFERDRHRRLQRRVMAEVKGRREAAERPKPRAHTLTDAIKEVVWRMTPYGEDDDGMIAQQLAAEVSRWYRTALLGDDTIDAAAEGIQRASSDARLITHDHREYLPEATRALTAALDRVEALNTEEADT